jgi:prenyltransferase beta subunit
VDHVADVMLAAAARGVRALDDTGREALLGFVAARRAADGGFTGRSEASDLYYTAFGLDVLAAAAAPLESERTAAYLTASVAVGALDLIHLACLARCWLRVGRERLGADGAARIAAAVARHATPDGGFDLTTGSAGATPYGVFLARTALEDLGAAAPDIQVLMQSIEGAHTADGAYANERGMEDGATPMTAGVVILSALSGLPLPESAVGWLLERWSGDGGFEAFPGVPVSDLLSTSTALFALNVAHCLPPDLSPCREFVARLWDPVSGGFRGHAFGDETDLEYTFYGLVALGSVST